MHISGLQLHPREPRASGVGDDVAVAEHGAFGVASGSTGEADGGEHVRAWAVELFGGQVCLPCKLHLLQRMDVHACGGSRGGFFRSGRFHKHNVLEGFALDLQQLFQLAARHDHGGKTGVSHDVAHSLVAESVVQRHSGDGNAVAALLRQHPLRSVLGKQADHAVPGHLVQVRDVGAA